MHYLPQSKPARTNCGWSEYKLSVAEWQNKLASIDKTNFRFHSDWKQHGKGFQIEYNTLQLITTCGGNYSNASGVLTSPSHPNPYPDLADCVYLISQPNGTYVNISFITMDIDCQGLTTLTSDYIEMRDGKSEDSLLIGRFCGGGSNVPDFLQTTQNHLRIRWKRKHLGKNILNNFNMLFILIPQILFQLFCEWPWISACIWINKCISRNDKQIWWMWRRLLFHHKWDNYLTILPRQLPGQRRLHLHHLTAHRHCHPAEYSQHRYTNMHIQLVQPMYFWLSRDQRWPFSWFISSGQTVWQWDPCSHSVQPEPTLDEVRRNICSKMSVRN